MKNLKKYISESKYVDRTKYFNVVSPKQGKADGKLYQESSTNAMFLDGCIRFNLNFIITHLKKLYMLHTFHEDMTLNNFK